MRAKMQSASVHHEDSCSQLVAQIQSEHIERYCLYPLTLAAFRRGTLCTSDALFAPSRPSGFSKSL